MMKLTIVAAAGALALFAAAASQPALAGADHMTPMPKATGPHAYTPAPRAKDAPKDYAHMTPMPTGSLSQAQQAQRAQQAQHK